MKLKNLLFKTTSRRRIRYFERPEGGAAAPALQVLSDASFLPACTFVGALKPRGAGFPGPLPHTRAS